MGFLYKDDKSGKFSDTTLRTWILFFLFVGYAIVIGIKSFFQPIDKIHFTLLDTFAFTAFGQSGLYLGKRVSEIIGGKK